ncbi:MAG TPA: hypothetical protein VGL44_07995 [Gaiellales bacterium]|jgi:hypothetical protein
MIDVSPPTGLRTGTCLVVATGAHVAPEVLATAIARVHDDHERLHVVVPAVLPPTLPISAMPPHLAARVDALRRTAVETFARVGATGRIEIVSGRDVRSAMLAAACGPIDAVALVGNAGWSLRRAARGIAPVTAHGGRAGSSKPDHRRARSPVPVTDR